MANINKVGPGDLITAQLMNDLIEAIQTLQLQVQGLQGGTTGTGQKPVIFATVPPNQIQAGAPIQVIGQNFSPSTDFVTFAGFSIDELDPGSGPTLLVFKTPTLTFTGGAKDIFVTVRNQAGFGSLPLKLLSTALVVHGTSSFATDGSITPPAALTKGGTFTFGLLFQSIADGVELYTFSLVFTNAVGTTTAQTWAQNAKLQDTNGNDVTTAGAIPVQPYQGLQSLALRVKLIIPAAAGDNDSVSIAIRATASSNPDQLNKISDPLQIKVGQSTPVGDPNLVFNNTTQTSVPIGAANRARRISDGNVEYIELPFKKANASAESGTIEITTLFKKDSTAEYKIDPPGGQWLFDDALSWGPKTSTMKHPGESELIHIRLKLNQEAPANASSHPELGTVKLTATRTNLADNTKVVSFTIINIRGYAG